MRRWVLIIMLLVYPFQIALAMADRCCVATPAGITHHGADQRGGPAAADPVVLADDADSPLGDPHCPACVFGHISVLPPHLATFPAVHHHTAVGGFTAPLLTSVPRSRPERPNWPVETA